MKDCVFCKIKNREIPKEFTYEDDYIMVFPDINPMKPVHVLVVPKEHIEDFANLNDRNLFFKIKKTLDKVVKLEGLSDKGYRISVNGGGAQIVNHLHFHVVGPIGKDMDM